MISLTFPNGHLVKLKKHTLILSQQKFEDVPFSSYPRSLIGRKQSSKKISNHSKFKAIIIKLNLI